MLSLTMREGDYLMIGKDIKLTFEKVVGDNKMYIHIDAPKSVEILRDKVYERALEDGAEANGELLRRLKKERRAQRNEYFKKQARDKAANV